MVYLHLLLTFLKVGALGFGGGYAMLSLIQFEAVERYQWLSAAEFTDIVAIAQSVPGPIAFNSATYIGYIATGSAWGSALASVAVCIPPFIIMLTICRFFVIFKENRYMRRILEFIKPVAIGLIGAAAVLLMNRQNFTDHISVIIFGVVLITQLYFKKLNPVVLIMIAGVAGYLLY
jgi:chromate transporter